MIDRICGYRHCEKVFYLPRTKYCSDVHMEQENQLVITDRRNITKVNQVKNPMVEKFDKPKSLKPPSRWGTIGSNSSVEAMLEIAQMFKS